MVKIVVPLLALTTALASAARTEPRFATATAPAARAESALIATAAPISPWR